MRKMNLAEDIRAIVDLLDYIEHDVEQLEPFAAHDIRRATTRLKACMAIAQAHPCVNGEPNRDGANTSADEAGEGRAGPLHIVR